MFFLSMLSLLNYQTAAEVEKYVSIAADVQIIK